MLALLAVRLADESAGFLVPGSLESWRSDLGLTYGQAGVVLAVAAPGAVAGNLFTLAADYRSRRTIAAGGAFGFALSLALFAGGASFPLLAAASFAVGVAATAMVDACEIALVDLVRRNGHDLEPNLARANLLGALGDLLGPLVLVAAAAAGLSWRVPLALGAALLAVYGVWLSTLPLPPPEPGTRPPAPRRAVASVVRDRRVWLLGALAALLTPLDEPLLAFLIAYLERVRALSPATAVGVALATIAGTVAGYLAVARRSVRTPDRFALARPGAVLTASALGLLSPWSPLWIPAAVAFGIAIAALWVRLQARVLGLRPGQTGTVKAVVTTIEMAGFVLPVLAGTVADAHGLTAGLACFAAFAAVLTLLALAADPRAHRRATAPAHPKRWDAH